MQPTAHTTEAENRSARKAAAVTRTIEAMTKAQLARGLHGLLDETIEDEVEAVMREVNSDDDGLTSPGQLEESDDEEEVATSSTIERALQAKKNEEEFDEYMNEELTTEEHEQDAQDRSEGPWESSLKMAAVPKPDLQTKFADEVYATDALEGLNFIEADEEEINATDDVPEYIEVDVAADSGAGDHVLARVDAPGHPVTESPGSKRGQKFKGAGGHVMDNEGQVLLEMLAPMEDGEFNEVDVTWQVTDVCRPLLSVSKVCDKGQHTVTFDAKRAVVRDSRGRIVCIFLRKGNLYIGRMKIKNPAHPSFGGQGK